MLQRDWLDDGALLMLLPEALLGAWHGVSTSDYDRACAVSDSWIASLPVSGGSAFVLGGDPGMALPVPDPDGSLRLVRWIYSQDEEELIAFALRGEDVEAQDPDLVFENPSRNWVMFDAAADPLVHAPLTRSFELPVCRIRVTTRFLKTEHNAAIVHAFQPDA